MSILTVTSVEGGADANAASPEVANVKLPAFLPELKARRRSSLERNDERQTTNPKQTFLTGVALVGRWECSPLMWDKSPRDNVT